jgi:signal transduction histidine kinase
MPRRQIFSGFRFRMAIQLVIGMVIVVSFGGMGIYSATKMTAGSLAQADLTMEIKIELLSAHLALEELFGAEGDLVGERRQQYYAVANDYIDALLNGGEYYEGPVSRLEHDRLVNLTVQVRDKTAGLQLLDHDIATSLVRGEDVSWLLQEYERGFAEIRLLLGELEEDLRNEIDWQIKSFVSMQAVLLFFACLGLILFAASRYRHEKNRESMLRRLELSNTDLEMALDYAKRVSREKADFFASMSHELRTPLHGILSFSRLGKSRVNTASVDKLGSYFQRINDSAERLLGLLNNLLDLSKIEAGFMKLDYKDGDLKALVEGCVSDVEAWMAESDLSVQWQVGEYDMHAQFDPLRMQQVVNNLLSNAIKFSPEGGMITIGMECKSQSGRDWISVSIRDEGQGIPEAEFGAIFDAFVQSSANSGGEGTGLGLPIAREIIELHNGQIYVDSSVGRFTCFSFEIPVRKLK